ncbi:MAG: prephenate dehydrogenase/arogenate dehydrogenase family protein [Sedimentisphaerales bacterium]|nr:prephenate dehydrogenase/arogenate dehydrogenase family protein [Sedimentisphaerales bacterium]NLZ05208.1 prephenate dehydrogenase/arogenate dehydrogenase family protein [Phycisphaerae bacterium]HNY79520.1 prephenate dehydrogenase/arogenate dehydrogenase family protein [Sedimentisphaerales bacterium]HOC62348.1 prephenate dehydrogenase/arogenate dehydrogenase family protein [Sedimentisphaerales bacterium]HOH65502.1 prephenate dehydrogenase/arogenate dehydrogenase family protein [Sedimentispha
MRDLRRICVIGLGLLGGSISSAVRHRLPAVSVVGYSHRAATRAKARRLAIATEVAEQLSEAVCDVDLVILATPIFTFAEYFAHLNKLVRRGCIITDVGSTKVLPHRWAQQQLTDGAIYIGSHPIAGSEQRGIEFARDDLFVDARCILTTARGVNRGTLGALRQFWSDLGCSVETMTAAEHDRILANVSHLPHIIATGLVNASDPQDMRSAGKGFLDSTRIASGPADIWTDVLLANADNIVAGIDRVLAELTAVRHALKAEDRQTIQTLLEEARRKRAALVKYKIRKKELL